MSYREGSWRYEGGRTHACDEGCCVVTQDTTIAPPCNGQNDGQTFVFVRPMFEVIGDARTSQMVAYGRDFSDPEMIAL